MIRMKNDYKIKKDKYLEKRGGTAKIVNVVCAACGNVVITYQKDGPGWLKRCYLNRIIAPDRWETLQHNPKINESTLGNLTCDCGAIIGHPMTHKDGRLAFRLVRGSFKRKNA